MAGEKHESSELLLAVGELLWIVRAALRPMIRANLQDALDTDEKRLAFHLSDGRGTRDILSMVKMGAGMLNELWLIWNGNGWGYLKSVRGGKRFIKTIDLEEFGLTIPKVKKVAKVA